MASKEHKELAQFLKEVHLTLRKSSSKIGVEQAWKNHCANRDVLKTYAQCMEKLATTHWEQNCENETTGATSRIKWAVDLCQEYFVNKSYIRYADKEKDIADKINVELDTKECFLHPFKLIDVGSCYNPFLEYDFLDVLAIDLCPANRSVMECDFLTVSIGIDLTVRNDVVQQLPENFFDVVTFCFLLEYIPSSELRINACKKAYRLLKSGGLLIINTPDSKHVGANSKLMKCWQYTLANIGFMRIKYEKFKHMHCMAFRKALCRDTAVRWAVLHKDTYMVNEMNIPQDFNNDVEESDSINIEVSVEDFGELPFIDDDPI